MIMGLIACSTPSDAIELEVKGSSIHTYLSIKDTKSKVLYKIQNKNNFDLMNKQNQTVTVKVKIIKEDIGPGFPAVVKVLEIK